MAFFTYAVKGFERGEVTGTQTSFAVISENGYEITGILFENGSTLCYSDAGLSACLSYDTY